MADLARVKENVAKMASMNAPEADIDGYIASEGVTVDQVRDFNPPAARPQTLLERLGGTDLARGVYEGLAGRGVGIIQAVGAPFMGDETRAAAAKAAEGIDEQGKGTGVAGLAGSILGDPLTYLVPAGAAGGGVFNTARALGVAGGVAGLTAPSGKADATAQQDERTQRGLLGAGLGAGLGTAAGAIPKLVGNVSPKMADRWATDYAARKLAEEGVTPDALAARVAQAKAAGTGETLAEAAQSPTLLSRQKLITKGTGRTARDAQQLFQTRAEQTIPGAVKASAGNIKASADEAGALFDEILARYPEKASIVQETRPVTVVTGGASRTPVTRVDQSSVLTPSQPRSSLDAYLMGNRGPDYLARNSSTRRTVSDGIDLGSTPGIQTRASTTEQIYDSRLMPLKSRAGGVATDDIYDRAADSLQATYDGTTEQAVMREVVDLLNQARERGGSFADIHRVKSQIGKIYEKFENRDAARAAKGLAGKFYTDLSDRLARIEPEYAVAEKLYRQKLAANDMIGILKDTQDGSTATLYSRLFGRERLREELRANMGDDQYAGLEALMGSLKRIKQAGMGGSDTAFNLGSAAEFAAEKGSMLGKAAEKPLGAYDQTVGRLGRWLNEAISKGDDAALMRVLTNPDVEKLGRLMRKYDKAKPGTRDAITRGWMKTNLPAIISDEGGVAQKTNRSTASQNAP